MKSNEFYLSESIGVIEEILASGGEFQMYPRGISMLPLIRQERDSVVLSALKDHVLQKHDIAFYRRDSGQFVLHRVMRCEADGTFTMCGDNQTYLEQGIRPDQIIGYVLRINRKGKVLPDHGFRRALYLTFYCCLPLRKLLFLPRRICNKIRRVFSRQTTKTS